MLGRYIILTYLHVNVFTDVFPSISISFYAFISAYAHIVRELTSLNHGIGIGIGIGTLAQKMDAGKIGGGGGGANQPGPCGANQPGPGGANQVGITLSAGQANGPIPVADPIGQNY